MLKNHRNYNFCTNRLFLWDVVSTQVEGSGTDWVELHLFIFGESQIQINLWNGVTQASKQTFHFVGFQPNLRLVFGISFGRSCVQSNFRYVEWSWIAHLFPRIYFQAWIIYCIYVDKLYYLKYKILTVNVRTPKHNCISLCTNAYVISIQKKIEYGSCQRRWLPSIPADGFIDCGCLTAHK